MLLLLMLAAPAAAFGFSAFRASPHTISASCSEKSSTAAGMMQQLQDGNWRTAGGSRRRSSRSRQHQRQRGVRAMSYEGGDFPSDVGDSAGSSAVPVVLADDNPELRATIKREILSIAATSNRCACRLDFHPTYAIAQPGTRLSKQRFLAGISGISTRHALCG